MASYDVLIDGRSRWRAKSESDLRTWLREYCEEHAEDDPDAAHVQIRRLSPWSWLTGGSVVSVSAYLRD